MTEMMQPMRDDDARLAGLVREVMGAKGLHELVTTLVAAMPEADRKRLVERILEQTGYSVATSGVVTAAVVEATKGIVDELVAASVARVTAALQEAAPKVEEMLIKSMSDDLKKRIEEKVREDFRFNRDRRW